MRRFETLLIVALPWLLFCLMVATIRAESSGPVTPAPAIPTATVTPWPTRTARSGVVVTMTPCPTPSPRRGGGLLWTMTPDPDHPRPTADRSSKSAADTGTAGHFELNFSPAWGLLCCIPAGIGVVVLGWRAGLGGRAAVMLAAWSDPVERQRRAERRERARIERDDRRKLAAIAREIAKSAVEVLTGVGYAHVYVNPGQRRKRYQEIEFSHAIIVGREQLMLRVGRIPMGKSRWDLFSNAPGTGSKPIASGKSVVSWYAVELYLALGRQVEIVFLEDVGIFFQISLKHGIAGVPKLVLWRDPERRDFDMMDGDPFNENRGRMPDVASYPASRLYIPVGLARNRKVVRRDLRALPHLIVSGTTGSGKSNFLNQMICTWLERNTPASLRLYLIDLKVVEFAHYLALSSQDREDHRASMIANVIQEEREAVEELERLYGEILRRQRQMAGVCINIEGWNQRAYSDPSMTRLPYIVVVFDELSLVMLSKSSDIRNTANKFIAKCLAVGRAFGVHMILCTQAINRQVVDMLVTANTPGKMIFRQATRTASINALGDGRAWTHLEQAGMGYFCDETGAEELVQTPLIFESQRDDAIRAELDRMAGRAAEPEALGDYLEILYYALANFDGAMPRDGICERFKGRGMPINKIEEWMRTHDGRAFYLGGIVYSQRAPAGTRGRALVPCGMECRMEKDANDIPIDIDQPTETSPDEPPAESLPFYPDQQEPEPETETIDYPPADWGEPDIEDEEAWYKEYQAMMKLTKGGSR